MRPVTIGSLGPDHHDAWLAFWRAYQAFYKVDLPAHTTATTWGRLLAPEEPIHGALAFAEGRSVGLVHWIFHRSTWTPGDYCYLQDLFVTEDARGLGVGRALIAHVKTQARTAGCSRVHWLTHETNSQAMVLYDQVADRSGFVQYRTMLG